LLVAPGFVVEADEPGFGPVAKDDDEGAPACAGADVACAYDDGVPVGGVDGLDI
jgi:hypothetical protein